MNLNTWSALLALPAVVLAQGGPSSDSTKIDALATKVAHVEAKVAHVEEEASKIEATLKSGEEAFAEVKTTVDKLAKIKVSGYIQAQWQYADSPGVSTVAGGNFNKTSTSTSPATANGGWPALETSQERFQIRRGRLKTTYDAGLTQYVLQIDVIPSGVSIKDAYATITEPWLKAFSGTAGVFDRPFGFEISYSSSAREFPERTRIFQTLFPGERDLGAKLEFKGTEQLGFLQYLNAKGGVFTGMGATGTENDNEKDYIGRLGFTAPFYDINLAIDGGFSVYSGKVTNITTKVSDIGKRGTSDTVAWIAKTGTKRLDTFDRNIMGADMQLYYDIPVIGGLSLRGEYVWGNQPSGSSNSQFYAGDTNGVFNREVAGWYIAAVQNLGTKVQAIGRYDIYDPNTEVDGNDIGRGARANLTANDIAYSTIGFGAVYHWDEWVKFQAYYDMVTNEEINSAATGGLVPFTKDLSDNVFTLRMQVKF